jgi:toxin-antitoxin system PIN domain toxin
VTLLDANILIYAAAADAPQHARVMRWLTDLFGGNESIAFTWPTIWAFVRISTDRRIQARARTVEDALSRVRDWLSEPGVKLIDAGPLHLDIFEQLVVDYQASGPLVSDAALAALAIEHGAMLASTDRDFSRFPSLKWVNPLDEVKDQA